MPMRCAAIMIRISRDQIEIVVRLYRWLLGLSFRLT